MSENTETKWRKDFPIAWGADNYVTRREFTKFLVLISGATCLGNGYFLLQRHSERQERFTSLEIASVDEMQNGDVKLFRYPTPDDPALLLRLANGDFVAYKQRCTHLSCPVHYAPQRGRLECPCHNGAFDAATGAVLQGPPPRPLPKILLRIAEGKIYAEGVEGS
ncbi:MAG TPA: Rieske 2Fe-2S domain-containing protein [Chthonomonadaceae bacterium]|nr:Rieske 2Fe-2S domain-containing protein [Chthonomonadaceae bacterium]